MLPSATLNVCVEDPLDVMKLLAPAAAAPGAAPGAAHGDAVQFGSTSSVGVLTALLATVTFHMPTAICAEPVLFQFSITVFVTVHVPAAKLRPPAPSTIQPLFDGVVEAVAVAVGVLARLFAGLKPGWNS